MLLGTFLHARCKGRYITLSLKSWTSLGHYSVNGDNGTEKVSPLLPPSEPLLGKVLGKRFHHDTGSRTGETLSLLESQRTEM